MDTVETITKGRWAWLARPELWISIFCGLAFYCAAHNLETAVFPDWPYRPLSIQFAWAAVLVAMVGVAWRWNSKGWSIWLLLHLFALGHALMYLLAWRQFQTGPCSVVADSWFQTAMVTKLRYTGLGSGDFAYRDLHAFYPSLYQWVVAKLAYLTSTHTLIAIKYGFYWVAYLAPIASFLLWKRLIGPVLALLMAVFSMFVCLELVAFKTFEVISAILFLPWALYYVVGLRMYADSDGAMQWERVPLERRQWLAGGVIGGLMFMTYYYYFFLLVIWVPLLFVTEWLPSGGYKVAWQHLRGILLMAGVMLLLSAVYWGPLVYDLITLGGQSFQNRWFQPHMLTQAFDYWYAWRPWLAFSCIVLLAAMGRRLPKSLVLLMVAVLLFMLLGQWLVMLGFPILHFRVLVLLEYVEVLGWAMLIWEGIRLARQHIQPKWTIALPIFAIGIASMSLSVKMGYALNSEDFELAKTYRQPILDGIPEFTDLAKGKVFLTNRMDLAAIKPLYLWISPNAHYNHPSARFRERLKLLVLLQHSRNSDFIAYMLSHNRYGRLDYVLLDNNHLDLFDDNFPKSDNHIVVPIQFDSTAFRGRYFEQDPDFAEIQALRTDVPEELWQTFDPIERRIAAIFCDIPALQASLPEGEMKALRDEVRLRTWDYEAWGRVFWDRWGR